jgi:hypothetical protein
VDPTQVQLVFGPVLDALARAEQGAQVHKMMCMQSSRS